MARDVFTAPPGWPPPPAGWRPPPGWRPDPAWEPAPEGWQFWRARRASGYCRAWVTVYWGAALLSTVALALSFSEATVPAGARLAVGFGWLATVGGALMAPDLTRRGIADVDFDSATSRARVVAVAWFLLLLILLAASVGYTGAGGRELEDPSIAVELTGGLTGTIAGAVALLAVVGEGWTAYRTARAALDDAP